jgi:small-conductance mechanosensitive channel
MDPQIVVPEAFSAIQWLWEAVFDFVVTLLTPGWRQYQVLIIVGLVVLSWLLARLFDPRVEAWARNLEGWPKWRLRIIVQARKRLGLILFAVSAWSLYIVMREVTWPSRSYLIGLAATLAIIWLIIGVAARFIHNRFLRRVVSWGLWIYATLYYLNWTDEVAGFLDRIALEIGEVRLSLLTVFSGLVVIGIVLVLARLLSQTLSANIRRNDDISPSMQVLAVKGVQVVIYGLAGVIAIRSFGFDLTGLAVLSGAIGVGLGFGLQKVVSNLVSGIIILLDKSIKPGDVISLGETFGWIQTLGARYASVVTRDGKEYLIPNEDLITGQVVNWSHSNEFVRLDIYFGTSYDDDPHLVRKIAIEAATSANRVLSSKPPVCHIVGFGDSSVDYILRFWITDPTQGLTNVKGQVYLALWDAFKANGISIPFPQREVRVLNDTQKVAVVQPDRTE